MANFDQCVAALQRGEVIAYPTESVFGIGCDPDSPKAVKLLLDAKAREKNKGLILIAAEFSQLEPYIDLANLSDEIIEEVLASWPGPVTWVMPAQKNVADWITGQFDTIAVRVSSHPDVQRLCLAYGKPITSTSANLSGYAPCRTRKDAEAQLGTRISCYLDGKTGGRKNPTEIRDARTGKVLRHG